MYIFFIYMYTYIYICIKKIYINIFLKNIYMYIFIHNKKHRQYFVHEFGPPQTSPDLLFETENQLPSVTNYARCGYSEVIFP